MSVLVQLVQRRVGRRAIGAAADLQDVLGGISLGELEVVDRPRLDAAHAGAGGEAVALGLLEIVDSDVDLAATGEVQLRPVLDAVRALVALPLNRLVVLVVEEDAILRATVSDAALPRAAFGRKVFPA